ncbi:MAG: hypothetical protein M3439_02565 [Chloroflexota bacterium]|nr:hypothetical protein [Chloroflexota bacterium]
MRGITLYELLAGLVLSLTAAVVGVWGVTRRDRPLHGPLDDGTLGLPRLQRWDVSYRPPRMQRLRSRFPRIEISRFVVVFCVVLIIAAGVTFVYSRSAEQSVITEQTFESSLAQVSQQRSDALAADDLEAAWAMLMDARADLDAVATLSADGTADARVAVERAAIDRQLADLSGMQQVANVQTVGAVPAVADGATARLVSGDGRVYLLSNAIYQVDVASSSLVLLLQPGDMVDNVPVETLRAAAWRENRLMVLDASRAYIFDPTTGGWTVEALGTFDSEGFTDIAAGDTFDFNLYLLARGSGQILKFQAGLYGNKPEDWTGGVAREELKTATDMAVDGDVWVLLPDGRILNFFRSRLEATIETRVVPKLERTSAIFTTAESEFLYVLSATDGRILRLTREGALVQQLTTGDQNSPLAGADDLVIDEASGIAYVLANDTVYTLRLPAAPAGDDEVATPEPE